MPPFPSVAMKGDIRHDGRSGQRKMRRSRLNEVGRKFPWPLIEWFDAERWWRKRDGRNPTDSGKRWQWTRKSDSAGEEARVQIRYKSLLSSIFAFILEDEYLCTTSSGSASLLHLYHRSFQRMCISCKVSQLFLLLLPAKETNSVFILWKEFLFILADSVTISLVEMRSCYYKCLFTLKSTMLSRTHSRHYVRGIACCTKIKHSDYALLDNAPLLKKASMSFMFVKMM